jgi:Flp pilus assembly protein CpaB
MRAKNSKPDKGLTIVRGLLLAAAVVVVAVLGYRQVQRLTVKRVPVWVSVGRLAKGRPLTMADLKATEMPPPSGAIVNRADIEGRTLLVDKAAGQPFYLSDLAPRPAKPPLATTIPDGRLLATVRIESMDLPATELMAGDRLDLLLAQPDGVRVVAHDVYVLGLLNTRPPAAASADSGRILGVDISVPGANAAPAAGSALVLGIYPEDAFSLAAGEATGKKMKIVLHSAAEVKSGEVLDLRPEPPPPAPHESPSVEVLRGAKSERIHVN